MGTTALVVVLVLSFVANAFGLGCISLLCAGNDGNKIANTEECSGKPKHCGSYGGKRFENSLMQGVDIACGPGNLVFAPFSGNMSFYRPRGGQNTSECIDKGLRIVGTGEWRGYVAQIAYIQPTKYSNEVRKGEQIGISLNHDCLSTPDIKMDPHILFQLYREGKPIDPTYRVFECMCTGQICQSNNVNGLKGEPFEHKAGVGKGYDLKCPNVRNEYDDTETAPEILSPIEVQFLGRFRPKNVTKGEPFACENDGVFLEGAGKWTDFTVHIYNAHFIPEPGPQTISQGVPVARRLNCPGKYIDSVFLEFRYKGRLVNVTNLISASNCKKPQLPD